MNILITGVSKGIGFDLAEKLSGLGHLVAGISRTEPNITYKFKWLKADVCNETEVKFALTELKKDWTQIDVLINNAGIASMNHSLLTPTDSFRKILETNTIGTFILSREVAKLMQKSRSGRIINFSTVAVPLALEGEAAYAASKAAIETLTRTMARELGPTGITVNCIGPCPVETDLTRVVPKEKINALIQRQAIKRFATTDDVLNVVAFLMNEKSSLITGQTIYLGGI